MLFFISFNVGMNIYKARSYDLLLGINDSIGSPFTQVPNAYNFSITDGNIAIIPGIASSIKYATIFYDYFCLLCLRSTT